ncbi:MAG TPA: stage VI sporulation protein F [Pseudogracilibacillus sp.]|nr:stage VI sporulation protein F [Pseudogracilibacillus sp.]
MDDHAKDMMKRIEASSSISMEEMLDVASMIQYENLQDEAVARSLVQKLSSLAGRSLPQDKEDRIVESIVNSEVPTSVEQLQRYFR